MPDWNSFLLAQGAPNQNANDIELSPEATYLMPLTQQGLLGIHGSEAAKFLQGQVTCDVRDLEANTTRLGAQCNIKGRMLLCFRALQTDNEHIMLRMHKELVANGLSSFGKYIVFSKAKLADLREDYRCIGIAGVKAAQVVREVLGIHLTQDNDWQMVDNSIVIRIDENRYECWLAGMYAENIWLQLALHCQIATQNLWTLLNIQAGLGDIAPQTLETFTPQAINLQLVNGINFRKGCYTGQEIVARLHYRGTLKRHMYRFEFSLADNALPEAGDELLNSQGKVVGEVVTAAQKNALFGELLASVVDDQRVELYLPGNLQKLSLLSLPYAIPTSDSTD